MEKNKIYNGDCLDIMKGFPDNSITGIITNPPYGLSFMNQKWDYDIPLVKISERRLSECNKFSKFFE